MEVSTSKDFQADLLFIIHDLCRAGTRFVSVHAEQHSKTAANRSENKHRLYIANMHVRPTH